MIAPQRHQPHVFEGQLAPRVLLQILQLPLPGQRARDSYDPFGMFRQMQVEERRVELSAEPETLTVLPLPRENVPANFNGAVGSFSLAQFEAGPATVAVGDPVTLKIRIAGKGSFDTLKNRDSMDAFL